RETPQRTQRTQRTQRVGVEIQCDGAVHVTGCDSAGFDPDARRKRSLIGAMTGVPARDGQTGRAPWRPTARAIRAHRARHGDSWPARWPLMARAMTELEPVDPRGSPR